MIRKWLRKRNEKPSEPQSGDGVPETISIAFDRLRLILFNFTMRAEKAGAWTIYAGAAASLWLSLAVTDFPTQGTRLGLTGYQWQIMYIIAASWATARSAYGFVGYLRRPRLESVINEIVQSAEIAREFRAICVLKVRGADHDYRVLVYHDQLWDCYLLPHYNVVDVKLQEIDDPLLCDFVASHLGVPASSVHSNYIAGADLRSRKHSEFYRQGTVYRFSFYAVNLEDEIPGYIFERSFERNGREFSWLTLAEMEADANTRNRNLDMTRHIADRGNLILALPPDSISRIEEKA
ncbi:hypothetical protein ACIBD9_22250 [Micromonospora sp. NPDC050784]|uniref:hypothetical protein n=1 Tax=Micromonospora sp. NPDC050784 TaxID=3364281 RepID=UPI003787A3F4